MNKEERKKYFEEMYGGGIRKATFKEAGHFWAQVRATTEAALPRQDRHEILYDPEFLPKYEAAVYHALHVRLDVEGAVRRALCGELRRALGRRIRENLGRRQSGRSSK